ncbi:hypothetical protein CsSME_00034825 [Camellia sinensis var. sinensis]
MYWFCEHSNIVEPQTDNMFPRFVKWDIGVLLKNVKVDRLRSLDYEREVIGTADVVVKEVVADVVGRSVKCADGDDHFVDERRVEVSTTNEVVHGGNVESRGGKEHGEGGIDMDGLNGSADAQGHDGAFCDVSDGGNNCRIGVEEVEFGDVMVCDVSPLRAVA